MLGGSVFKLLYFDTISLVSALVMMTAIRILKPYQKKLLCSKIRVKIKPSKIF